MGSSVRAEISADSVAQIKAAMAKFDALVRVARTTATLPRYADTAAKGVLDQLWDSSILARRPHRKADVPALIDLLDVERSVLKTYLLFAIGGAQTDAARNGYLFQDELSRAADQTLQVFAAISEAMVDFWDGLPIEQKTEVRRDGLRQVRRGAVEFSTGQLLALSSKDLSIDNSIRSSGALVRSAPAINDMLSLSERQALIALANTVNTRGIDKVAADIKAYKIALAGTSCNSICTIE
jgi:hypothetical protein